MWPELSRRETRLQWGTRWQGSVPSSPRYLSLFSSVNSAAYLEAQIPMWRDMHQPFPQLASLTMPSISVYQPRCFFPVYLDPAMGASVTGI